MICVAVQEAMVTVRLEPAASGTKVTALPFLFSSRVPFRPFRMPLGVLPEASANSLPSAVLKDLPSFPAAEDASTVSLAVPRDARYLEPSCFSARSRFKNSFAAWLRVRGALPLSPTPSVSPMVAATAM